MTTTNTTESVIIRRELFRLGVQGHEYDYMAVEPCMYDRACDDERWGRKSEAATCARAEAEKWLEEANAAVYYTRNGEYARPEYTILRTPRNK